MSNDTLKDIQDYLENLCRNHVDLMHDPDNNRRAFARFRTDEHITELTNSTIKNIVVVAEINGQLSGDRDENEIRRGVAIIFASNASNQGKAATAIDDANKKSEDIMFDFISRMQFDQANECGLNFDFDQISWNDIEGPWLDNFYGWMLFLPFKGYLPPYDENKWTDS